MAWFASLPQSHIVLTLELGNWLELHQQSLGHHYAPWCSDGAVAPSWDIYGQGIHHVFICVEQIRSLEK